MKLTFRWYGESDPIPIEYIKQIPGNTGVMGMIDTFEAGEVWDEETIKKFVEKVNSVGLEAEVIESVNVHEDIKQAQTQGTNIQKIIKLQLKTWLSTE